MEQPIEYEWLPTKFSNCKKLGHTANSCKFVVGVVWRKKDSKSIPEIDISKNVVADGSKQSFDVNDRIGGRPISVKEMEDSQQWLALRLVEEMKIMGPYFTWSNNQEGGNHIFYKLHRVFSNEAWLDSFPLALAFSQWEVVSDHSILLIKHVKVRRMGVKLFRYYNMWSSHAQFRETVLDSWSKPLCTEGSGLAKLVEKLVQLKHKEKLIWSLIGKRKSMRVFFAKRVKSLDLNDYEMVTLHFLQHFQSFLGCASRANGHIDPQIKSTGPDGYGAGFFKDSWKDIGKEVSLAVLDFFETGEISQSLNETLLMLCGRLPTVLPSLINQNQGVFIKHRSIAYNVLIFQDLIKEFNRKNSFPQCAMKIDLSKAHDSIDWDFLENLLNALCFPSRFIGWIMVCLRGTSYSLVMNGRIQGHFKGGKGLRQGDPISSMLFVIVMDYLTRILMKASKKKGFRFHPMCKSINLVNLYFADDLLIFCKANSQLVQILHRELAKFQKVSGLSINHNKSHIYLGELSEIAKASVLNCTNMIEGSFPLKYLGVPLRPTKCKASNFGIILRKIRLRLNNWASWNLSYAGRTQLVQSVLLGIRIYWMSIFLLPQGVDQLWMKWVNNIYLKGSQLWDYILKQDDNWYWRKLIKLCNSVFEPALAVGEVHGKLRLGKLYNHFLPGEKIA
ncbi:uncharacterized protein LOC133814859 [Humulus lupulus]|uniref:uncharacterized protein LOC133814859 n=1 Tax=Humulus lupulus TaxID=3486 RepID=UPI002B40FF70|nr:uncharacterized protein LOC133814859 [Humulus lupulus]